MSKVRGKQWCQQCGKYAGSGSHADLVIILVPVKNRLLCQYCRPKTKPVVVAPEETQLSFEEKGN